jgi:hypothetical protein
MSDEFPRCVRYPNALMVRMFGQLGVTVRDPLTTSILGLYTFLSTVLRVQTLFIYALLSRYYITLYTHRMTEIIVLGMWVHITRI